MKPRWNEDAEASVLGAAMLDRSVMDRVTLEPRQFFHPAHQEVWAAMRALHAGGKPLDPVMLENELARREKLAAVGGLTFLCNLTAIVPTADNVEHYAEIVARDALDRAIRTRAAELVHSTSEGDDFLAEAMEAFARFGDKRVGGAKPIGEWLRDLWREFAAEAEAAQHGRSALGVPTGMESMQELLGALPLGVVTILGGRPSMGKSSLARTIADNASAAGQGVHVFSMEDTGTRYARRVLADHASIDLHRLSTGSFQRGDLPNINAAGARVAERRNWLVDDVAGLSSTEIGMRVRRHKAENGTRLVVVDYVQIMREPGIKAGEPRLKVAAAAEGLQILARKENVALLLISQLSRSLESREDKRPVLSDLREAGELEQIADIVAFCYRHEVYEPSPAVEGKAEVIIRKNKNGRLGTVNLEWDAPTATFRDKARPRFADRASGRMPGEDDE